MWPLLLLVLLRRGTRLRWILTGLLLAAAASGLLRLALWADEATNARLHYGPDTRADAILLGCVLAFAIVRWHRPLGLGWLAVGALGLVATFVWVDERDVGYPYGLTVIALVPVVFTAWAVLSPDRHHAWLEHPALVRVGKLSYGLYLWRYPILRGGDSVQAFPPDPWQTIVLVAASWIAAELSWRIVETPFLRCKARLSARRDQSAVTA